MSTMTHGTEAPFADLPFGELLIPERPFADPVRARPRRPAHAAAIVRAGRGS